MLNKFMVTDRDDKKGELLLFCCKVFNHAYFAFALERRLL